MPSKKKTNHQSLRARMVTHQSFFSLVTLTLLLWFLYRSLFNFPVWFDESIGKAVFFGLPVWAYVTITGFRPIIDSLNVEKIKPGLLRGVALGGIFGFITLFIRLLQNGGSFQVVPMFFADQFWWEFLLAMLTAFWESLFFFSFVMTVIQNRFAQWSLGKQIVLVMSIFLLFHIPNAFLRFNFQLVPSMFLLLTLFALGQSLIFAQKHNAYTIIMTHTIWGMCLLLYF